ncbi:MAG: PQQ-dependent sugar dehydrogenase [Chloroflexi bacterium]|nr:PQQ-dependent sugar dehydrogenase [Chloroflexota bacterium]
MQVGTGENHACAVRVDGSARCWGNDDAGQLGPPSGVTFREIASGSRFSCGITTEGTLACWGRNDFLQANPPDGQFTEVSAGRDHACAIGPDGATCWGRDVDERAAVPPGVAFTAIGVGAEHGCGLTAIGDLTCWGKNDNGRADSRKGPFRALAVGVAHTCVLGPDGRALCQGQSDNGGGLPPATVFNHLSAGSDRTCGVQATGQVECWDARPIGAPLETFGPPGAYTGLSVGWHDACAINEVGQVACWSSAPDPLPEPYNRLLVVNAFPDIELDQPVELIPWPHGGLAVADKRGSIAVLSSEFGLRPLLDLTDVVYSDEYEMGMLSAAVDPEFERSPFLYVYYTLMDKDDGDRLFARLSRFPVVDGVAVRERELVILDIQRETQDHGHWGGAIRFGPDGMMYVGLGDSNCPECAQGLDSWHGKIIRIDVRGASTEQLYWIPADNPLLDTPNAQPEIWAYGLRNPWRMAFDPQDGKLWVGDVGGYSEEEVSIVTPGADLGWPKFEGFTCIKSGGVAEIDPRLESAYMCQFDASLTMPVVSYDHRQGCAIVGGMVYRGALIPSLNGGYLFGDYCLGIVWALDSDVERGWGLVEIADLDRPLSSFGIDADGEVFMVTFGGALVRLIQTQVGYADSVTHKARVTTLGTPLDSKTSPSLGDRGT